MLKIRLSRTWRKHRPFYKVVLTEHTKPVKSWYKSIFWWYDPNTKKSEINIEKINESISLWAIPTERVAKIIFHKTNDPLYKKYFSTKEIKRDKKNPDKYQK